MSTVNSVIIVGASAAGVSCLRGLRNRGFTGKIILIDKDKHGAYERPPLSKQILLDQKLKSEDISLITTTELSDLNIESYFGESVTYVLPDLRKVTLESGVELAADAIVLATGGEARRLPIEGSALTNIFVLRHFQDAVKLREKLLPNSRVAVIGGGFIGAETSASLCKLGVSVHWLDAAELPLAHILPYELCEKIVNKHCDDGLNLITNCRIKEFVEQGDGSLSILFNDDRESLNVDAIVLGVGMAPYTPYFSEQVNAKILNKAKGGIEVNESQESKYPGIYAAGDVAAIIQGDGSVIRHEHWQSAQFQGERTATSILNISLPSEPVDWFWSDQGDLHIEMAGVFLPNEQQLVVRNEGDWPVYFSVLNNRVVGTVSVNNPNAVRAAMRMIKNAVTVDVAQLENTDLPLRKLMRG